MNFFSPCIFQHSRDWTRVVVNGVWWRQCERCLTPTTAILADRGAQEDIQPAQVPPIVVRTAVKMKKTKTKRPSKSLRFPRSA